MKNLRIASLALCCFVFLPAAVWAQTQLSGSVAGVVKDTSGAVMPGVTVEAASPALIEGIRSAVTDSQGLVNGRYTLDASPLGATCKRSRTKPNFTLAVNELSSLAFGGASLVAFVRTGRSHEHRAGTAHRADRLFRGLRAPWNPTRF